MPSEDVFEESPAETGARAVDEYREDLAELSEGGGEAGATGTPDAEPRNSRGGARPEASDISTPSESSPPEIIKTPADVPKALKRVVKNVPAPAKNIDQEWLMRRAGKSPKPQKKGRR